MNNRRDFLKWFGIGAAIAPVVAGVPIMEAESTIIKAPTVEPVKFEPATVMPQAFMGSEPVEMIVTFSGADGKRQVFKCNTFITSTRLEPFIAGNSSVSQVIARWTMEGTLLSERRKI